MPSDGSSRSYPQTAAAVAESSAAPPVFTQPPAVIPLRHAEWNGRAYPAPMAQFLQARFLSRCASTANNFHCELIPERRCWIVFVKSSL